MELNYKKYGTLPQSVIIIHGFLGSSDNWASIARALSDNYTVYVPDMRNHGESPHSSAFNCDLMVGDLKAFIATHHISDPVIIGHSMGGKVAMRFAIQNPDMVKKLVVVDIGVKQYSLLPDVRNVLDQMMDVDLSGISRRSELQEELIRRGVSEREQMMVMKNVVRTGANAYRWRLNLPVLHANMYHVLEPATEPEDRFDKQTLFIRGGKSKFVLDEDLEDIYTHFPNHALYTIPEATHWVHYDAPEKFMAKIREFVGS